MAQRCRKGILSCNKKNLSCRWLDKNLMRCVSMPEAEATLESERVAFDATKACLEDDLNRTLVAQDEAESREREAIDHCQRALKVFKYKKYKDRYENWKRSASPRYPLKESRPGTP